MNKGYPIGVDDFKEIIEQNLYFVDKTMCIKEMIEDSSKVTYVVKYKLSFRNIAKKLSERCCKYGKKVIKNN